MASTDTIQPYRRVELKMPGFLDNFFVVNRSLSEVKKVIHVCWLMS